MSQRQSKSYRKNFITHNQYSCANLFRMIFMFKTAIGNFSVSKLKNYRWWIYQIATSTLENKFVHLFYSSFNKHLYWENLFGSRMTCTLNPSILVPQPILERPSITTRHYIVPNLLKTANKIFSHIRWRFLSLDLGRFLLKHWPRVSTNIEGLG